MRKITVPAGIGDNIWLIQKLINTGEKFDFVLPDGQPQRGHQIYELLPQVCNSVSYSPGLNYSKLKQNNIQKLKSNWKQIQDQKFFLTANEWLEEGKRLEGFLPDLPITYNLDYVTTEDHTLEAEILLEKKAPYIGVYASAYSNARHWNAWCENEWMEFIEMVHSANPDVTFVMIGATYDIDLADKIIAGMKEKDIAYVTTIGQPLPVVVEVLKRLKYFVGFPSGLSILNESLGKDGVMFYPKHLQPMINSWAHPERISAGNIKECLYCEPAKIFDWIKNDYQLFKRL